MSKKKRKSNKKNAQKSTGPVTPEGKEIASENATKHGAYSDKIFSPGDDDARPRFIQFCKKYYIEPEKPATPLEYFHTLRIAWNDARMVHLDFWEDRCMGKAQSEMQISEIRQIALTHGRKIQNQQKDDLRKLDRQKKLRKQGEIEPLAAHFDWQALIDRRGRIICPEQLASGMKFPDLPLEIDKTSKSAAAKTATIETSTDVPEETPKDTRQKERIYYVHVPTGEHRFIFGYFDRAFEVMEHDGKVMRKMCAHEFAQYQRWRERHLAEQTDQNDPAGEESTPNALHEVSKNEPEIRSVTFVEGDLASFPQNEVPGESDNVENPENHPSHPPPSTPESS